MRLLLIGLLFTQICLITGLFSQTKLSETVPTNVIVERAPVDTVFDKALVKIINSSFRDQYFKAVSIADSLMVLYPDHPAPYFFKAASLQGWMSSYRLNQYQSDVEENVQKAIDTGNALLEKKNDPWLHFYLGGAYGYRGFNRFRTYNWIGAYRDAIRGIDHFEKALQEDSTLYDVYLGLGSYYYWRTAKSKFLRVITFWMADKRELGVRQLQFAIDHGRYAIYEALYGLIMIYYDFEKYDKGLKLLNDTVRKRGKPIIADLYYGARFHEKANNWQQVYDNFSEILKKLESEYPTSIGFQVECKYWIAKALSEQGENREALLTARQGLMQSRQRDSDQEIEGYLESFDEIKSNLEKLHKQLNQQISKQY
jgi:tetratricopeptide (TPR) repeat protein